MYKVISNPTTQDEGCSPFTHCITWQNKVVAWCETLEAARNLLEDLASLTEQEIADAESEHGKN